ncbi:uncharacterized protein MYCFIDRAFT_199247 [Pseudocercospora fijiensis CIRAD86]|uniref:Uncharacterized protein n=1 Tax=Pseudocercospora fijiensis (strain CIRAD86) TaxID=383855 RepID=M2ZK79_PSEFD|nr:uncharacterized protein MYCFIDRAFT_199247 [Pseudocercospora fijiensis CIRAD86]EME79509.1 hypothetical protein MYCFIDRAFT_199247 [Pseudocercospora fijiensis CIRAD86]
MRLHARLFAPSCPLRVFLASWPPARGAFDYVQRTTVQRAATHSPAVQPVASAPTKKLQCDEAGSTKHAASPGPRFDRILTTYLRLTTSVPFSGFDNECLTL